jgi:hypothetical protein
MLPNPPFPLAASSGNIVVLAAHVVAGDPTVFADILSVPTFMVVLCR